MRNFDEGDILLRHFRYVTPMMYSTAEVAAPNGISCSSMYTGIRKSLSGFSYSPLLTKSKTFVKPVSTFLPALVIAFLFAPLSLSAQSNSSYLEEEKREKGREAELALHFYPYSFLASALDQSVGGGSDDLPFPFLDVNYRYNAYEGGIAYRNPDDGFVFRLKSRYNLALAKQSIGRQSLSHIRGYLYGGIDLWHLSKKEIQNDRAMRSASNSTILGISMGAGIGFYFGTGLGLSIEPEYNYIPCDEDQEFFCPRWFDVKVGLEILFLLK